MAANIGGLRESVEALTARGMSAQQIADELGCSKRTVVRWRSAIRGTPWDGHVGPVPLWKLQRAQVLVAEGAAQSDIARTLGMAARTVERHFPGSAWSQVDAGRHARLARKMNDIDPRRALRDVS